MIANTQKTNLKSFKSLYRKEQYSTSPVSGLKIPQKNMVFQSYS